VWLYSRKTAADVPVNESPVSLPEAVEVPESQEDETTATEDESLADEDSTEAAVDVSPEVEA
jgi:hypothetical protein